MMARRLSELVPGVPLPVDMAVEGLTDDSRQVQPGWLFIATRGLTSDGRDFIDAAVSRAAAAVLCESPAPASRFDVPVIEVDELAMKKGEIASRFYGEPSKRLLVIGVTGTNGKTSCSQFIASALCRIGKPCGVIGTLGFGMPGKLTDAGLTTPDAIGLQRRLSQLLAEGCEAVALEASSHGLAQGRLAGTAIDISVFTNITRDHLDYHETFADYRRAKQLLFTWRGLKAAVINLDDEFADELIASCAEDVQVITYSVSNRSADVHCDSLAFRQDGMDLEVVSPWGNGEINSGLLGEFNASNLLAVVAVLGLLEYDMTRAFELASGLCNVPGRMDVMRKQGMPLVVIDYAHTPDALEKALLALRRHCQGALWCVVGCGGDRDKGKRPLMGRIVSEFADRGIITDDNPRTEPSADIIGEIMAGVAGSHVEAVANRSAAIAKALAEADAGDILLIAGKGHEEYHEVNGVRQPFSDFVEVEKVFAAH